MRNRSVLLLSVLGALFALVLLAGCGGGDSGGGINADTDPAEVLDGALGSEAETIDSGVLDLGFDLEASGDAGGSLSASVEGPFQSGGEDQLPLLDLDAAVSFDAAAEAFEFDGGLTITADGAFVTYDGTAYEVDDQTFTLLQQSYAQSSQLQESEAEEGGSLEAFGIDPAEWLTDLTNEGTEDVDGTEVVHVTGTADVPKLVADIETIAEQTGQASELDEAGLRELEDSVTDATIDVYVSTEDNTLRKLDLSLDVADSAGGESATVSFSIGIADPNDDQEISAPDDPQPIADLLGQFPGGVEALGGLGGATGSGTGSAGGSGATGAAEDYYDCAAQAQSSSDLEACAALAAP